jgi:hypothetical protein
MRELLPFQNREKGGHWPPFSCRLRIHMMRPLWPTARATGVVQNTCAEKTTAFSGC